MKRELRFLLRYSYYPLAGCAVIGAICLGGVWLRGSLENTFGTYLRIFPILALMLVWILSGQLQAYFQLGLRFGARRGPLFAAWQVLGLTDAAACMALSAAVWVLGNTPAALAAASIPMLPLGVLGFAAVFFCFELGTFFGGFSEQKRWIIALCTILIVLAMIGMTIVMMFATENGTALMQGWEPLLWLAAALLAVLSAGLGLAAWPRYRKAVVTV